MTIQDSNSTTAGSTTTIKPPAATQPPVDEIAVLSTPVPSTTASMTTVALGENEKKQQQRSKSSSSAAAIVQNNVKTLVKGIVACDTMSLVGLVLTWVVPALGWFTLIGIVGGSILAFCIPCVAKSGSNDKKENDSKQQQQQQQQGAAATATATSAVVVAASPPSQPSPLDGPTKKLCKAVFVSHLVTLIFWIASLVFVTVATVGLLSSFAASSSATGSSSGSLDNGSGFATFIVLSYVGLFCAVVSMVALIAALSLAGALLCRLNGKTNANGCGGGGGGSASNNNNRSSSNTNNHKPTVHPSPTTTTDGYEV